MSTIYKRTYLMYLPVVILLLVFVAYPFVKGIQLSFTDWNGYSPSYQFIGLENYSNLWQDPVVKRSILNTLFYGFGSTLFQQLLGLGYALLVNKKFLLRGVTRFLVYLPALISGLVMGYMWYFMTRFQDGALNAILNGIGLESVNWLTDKSLAVVVIVAVNVLQFCGISMVIYSAGLQNIPMMYYEAAELDGASKWQTFKEITIPLLYPSIVTSVTLNLIGGLKLFDVIKALTNGGPNYTSHSLSSLINDVYFSSQNAGYASTIGILLFVIILIVTILLQVVFRKGDQMR